MFLLSWQDHHFHLKKIVCSEITIHSAKVFNSQIFRAFYVGFTPKLSTWNFQNDMKNHELQSYWESYKKHKFRLQQNVTIFILFHKGNFRKALQCRSRTLPRLHVLLAKATQKHGFLSHILVADCKDYAGVLSSSNDVDLWPCIWKLLRAYL